MRSDVRLTGLVVEKTHLLSLVFSWPRLCLGSGCVSARSSEAGLVRRVGECGAAVGECWENVFGLRGCLPLLVERLAIEQ